MDYRISFARISYLGAEQTPTPAPPLKIILFLKRKKKEMACEEGTV
jgi:hypothetical protein